MSTVRRSQILFALAVSLLASCTRSKEPTENRNSDDTAIRCRWKWNAGDRLCVQIKNSNTTTTSSGETRIERKSESIIDEIWHVESVDDQGVAKVIVTVDRYRLLGQGPEGQFKVDSELKNEDNDEDQLVRTTRDFFKALRLSISVDSRGDVQSARADDDFVRRVASNPLAAQFQNFLSEDGIKETFRQMIPPFPEKGLQKGAEWKDSVVVKNPDGNQTMNLLFKYEGVVNRNEQPLEHFTVIGKLDLLNYGANSNLNFEINAQENKGDIYFDNTAGRMVDSQTTQTLTITATDNDRQAQRVVTTESKIAFKKCDP